MTTLSDDLKKRIEKEADTSVFKTTLYGRKEAPLNSDARSRYEAELRCWIGGATEYASKLEAIRAEVLHIHSIYNSEHQGLEKQQGYAWADQRRLALEDTMEHYLAVLSIIDKHLKQ